VKEKRDHPELMEVQVRVALTEERAIAAKTVRVVGMLPIQRHLLTLPQRNSEETEGRAEVGA